MNTPVAFRRAVLAMAIALAPALAFAQQSFDTAPVIRVETGSHLGIIRAVTSDSAGRYLVTGGADKTVRMWSQATGELLKVIRPPIGEGTRGTVDGLAISPDGTTVAVAGNFCLWHEATACVLLFDAASGRMSGRLRGLPSPASRLFWSRDGAVLAVGLVRGGLRMYRTTDWTEIASDPDYAGRINEIDMTSRGAVATASDDRTVRLYTLGPAGLALTAKKTVGELRTRGSGTPVSVRFSPDGTRVAIAQSRGANVTSVHNAANLGLLYAASTNWGRGIGSGSLAWSPDGEYLYAAMLAFEPQPLFIRRWGNGGRGFATDLPVGTSSVQALTVMKDGSLGFGTADGVMGVYDASGKLAWDRSPLAGRFHGTTQALRLSADGTRVQFSYDGSSQGTLNFDLTERRLSPGEVRGIPMRSAAVAGGTMNFFNLWRDTRGAFQAGNTRLRMGAFETSRSLSIAPDNASFVVGTNSQIRNFAPGGRQLWAVPAYQGYAVNHSGDGRLVVVADGYGTLRWINRQTGRFLAMLYVAPDRKRWVLASASGYYDASLGAEDFLGWHINRSPDTEADFVPISRLRARFYRPEVVAQILKTGSDAQAVQLARAELAAGGTVVPPVATPAATVAVPPPRVTTPAPSPPAIAVAPPAPIPAPPPAVASPPAVVAPPVAAPLPPPVVAAPPKPVAPPPTIAAAPRPEPAPPPVAATPAPPRAEPPEASAPETEAGVEEAVESTVTQTQVSIAQVLPPVVTILSPAPGSEFTGGQVTVRYLVRTEADAPLLGVRARVNGLAHDSRTLQVAPVGEVREITVNVPQENSEVMLFAENRHGISAAASVKLTFRGQVTARVDDRPTLYVLAIGVSDYDNPQYRLNFAAKDARDFVTTVQKQKGRMYADAVVRVLTDHEASSVKVIEAFAWLQKQVTAKDIGMVFIAGHGINDDKGKYYFLPANVQIDRLSSTGVPFNEIRNHLANLRGKGLLFVDTCHSGNVMGGRFSSDVNGVLNDLSSAEYGLVVLASSTGKQFSLEDPSWGNGAFTKALVEGLNGQADLKHRGRITHKMLDFYVSDRVDELTKGQQTPVNPSPQGVPDYAIALTGN